MTFDPSAPGFLRDPYPAYQRLRESDPVHWSPRLRSWVLTRHRDVEAFFHESRLSADRSTAAKGAGQRNSSMRSIGSDPPEHTAVRTLAAQAFTPREVEKVRPRVEQITDQLLDRLADCQSFDLISDFAYPLPITVIAEMFGVPESDRPQFQEWSRAVARSMDHMYSRSRQSGAMAALTSYFAGLVEERTRNPGDDLMSRLLIAEDGAESLTAMEIVALAAVLIFAGHETTTNLIGNGVLALLSRPEALDRMRDDEKVVRTGVEELLRFDSPAQMINRVVACDVEIEGRSLSKGETVLAVLGAANRDPSVFDEPDSLRLEREPNPHLAFGHGIHFCLGAVLSRREAQVALPALLGRFPRIRLTGEPVWRETMVLRGLESLPVSVS